jgi:hypothetical protein
MRRRRMDAKIEEVRTSLPPNVHREVWSPFDFDKKYLELADRFLEDDDTDKAA